MLTREYGLMKEAFDRMQSAVKKSLIAAHKTKDEAIRNYGIAEMAVRLEEQLLPYLEAESARLKREGADAIAVDNQIRILNETDLPRLRENLEGHRVAKEAAETQLDAIKTQAQAIQRRLDAISAEFGVIESTGVVPPADNIWFRFLSGGLGIATASAVSGAIAGGIAHDTPPGLAMGATVATALGSMNLLSMNRDVANFLKMPGIVTIIGSFATAVFKAISDGELTAESFTNGLPPFLVALWTIDVIGLPLRSEFLKAVGLSDPSVAQMAVKMAFAFGIVALGVTLGPGLLGGAPLPDVFLGLAIPFAAAIITKGSIEDALAWLLPGFKKAILLDSEAAAVAPEGGDLLERLLPAAPVGTKDGIIRQRLLLPTLQNLRNTLAAFTETGITINPGDIERLLTAAAGAAFSVYGVVRPLSNGVGAAATMAVDPTSAVGGANPGDHHL